MSATAPITLEMPKKPNIPTAVCGMLPPALEAEILAAKLPKFRAKQLSEWVWDKFAGAYDEMTNLPKELRVLLAEELPITPLALVKTTQSGDDTRKFLFRLADGNLIESVLISAPGRLTACVSSQVGCALACSFCASGLQGLVRNLAPARSPVRFKCSKAFKRNGSPISSTWAWVSRSPTSTTSWKALRF